MFIKLLKSYLAYDIITNINEVVNGKFRKYKWGVAKVLKA